MNNGMRLSLGELADGRIAIRAKTGDIRALRAIVPCDRPPVSIETMTAAVAVAVSRRFKASTT